MGAIDSILGAGLRGLKRSLAGVSERASEIARSSSDPNVDLSESIVGLKREEQAFKASARVVQVGAELEDELGRLLDEKA